ncbi:MAG: CPBP family intramembrane metalloprotease [Candidatus Polarisedimenticolaceae bacterium]|nr:CPBP family intramembrane metalloprotease [Candidatus Polarisedimenticolaceae bacterium]
MRAFAVFTGFLACCLLISALLHYPLYLLLDGLLEVPAHKQVPRAAKLIALPGFFLLIIWLGLYHRKALGFGLPRPVFLRQMFIGWLYGVLILAVLSAVLIGLGVRTLDPVDDDFLFDLAKVLISGLIGGLLIGLIEETFFRGAMYQAIRRNAPAFSAIAFSSLLYAAVHFIDPVRLTEPVGWLSGLQILAGAFWQLGDWATLDSFIALFVVGAFLGVVREQTGNIAYCIGLHAGWVLIIKCTKKFTSNNHGSEWAFLTGSYDGITGYLAAIWLLLLISLYWLYIRRSTS